MPSCWPPCTRPRQSVAPPDARRWRLSASMSPCPWLVRGACGLISEDVAEFAVAIRCALLTPDTLRLHAGAGIVSGSEPAAEWQELDDKLANLLGLLSQGSRP